MSEFMFEILFSTFNTFISHKMHSTYPLGLCLSKIEEYFTFSGHTSNDMLFPWGEPYFCTGLLPLCYTDHNSASPQAVTVYKPEALPPENSTFLERNFVCRLRCLLDNSTGFLVRTFGDVFILLVELHECVLYTFLLCNLVNVCVCVFPCPVMKTGESGMTVFRLLTKLTGWVWVQANARLVYNNGRPECIIASQRVLTDDEGEENLRKRSLQLPFSYTTGEALLYDTSFPKTLVTGDSLAGDTTGPAGNTTNNNQDGTLDPDSLLGSLLKQDKSVYWVPQEEVAGLPQEECGGIFSSSWQEGSILSLSERVLFKQEPLGVGGDWDLWSFMMNLGISREDLELFQQDEMFLDVDLDAGRDGLLPDLTDEILSYVQESLRKRSDWGQTVFSYRGAKLGDQDNSCPTMLLHQPSMEQPLTPRPHSTTVPQWQSQIQPPQLPVVHPHPLSVLPNQQQLKHMQVTGTGSITQRQEDITKQQQIPPLFNVEQPWGLQTHHGLPQHGHLCLGEASLALGLPYRNQLNTLSVSRSPVLSSYVPTTGLQSQGVDGELTPQNLDELLGSLESSGPRRTEDGRGGVLPELV
uniref:Aryl hydrocarbon receptor 1b n=1 Tax=Hucho hucho TaxID=62062 RepID=A0A4W5PIW3_9TELE